VISAFTAWFGGIPTDSNGIHFEAFSQTYTAMIVFAIQVFVTMKRDLSIFIKLMSYGTYFIMGLMLFIVAVGLFGFTNTTYHSAFPGDPVFPTDPIINPSDNNRNLFLFNTNFSPLAG
jgi:hypothetical protein